MNTDIIFINITKKTYNYDRGGTGGSSKWEYLTQLIKPRLIILNDP